MTEKKETAVKQIEAQKRQNKFGKFPGGAELYKAYCALEAEFTKRCQEFKRLEGSLLQAGEENRSLKERLAKILDDEDFLEKAALNERLSDKVIRAYLARFNGLRNVPLLKSGSGFAATVPAKKPKTLEEAKALAERFLK